MLTSQTAADAIYYAMTAEPQAVPMKINIQPDSHLFLISMIFASRVNQECAYVC
jgi:uncharacterized protein (UPF0332 family)